MNQFYEGEEEDKDVGEKFYSSFFSAINRNFEIPSTAVLKKTQDTVGWMDGWLAGWLIRYNDLFVGTFVHSYIRTDGRTDGRTYKQT